MAIDRPLEMLFGTVRRLQKREDETMGQAIKKSVKDIVKATLDAVPAISVEETLPLVNSEPHVFVDLRDGTEQAKTGVIPGAVASSRGMLEFHIDPDSSAHKPELN